MKVRPNGVCQNTLTRCELLSVEWIYLSIPLLHKSITSDQTYRVGCKILGIGNQYSSIFMKGRTQDIQNRF